MAFAGFTERSFSFLMELAFNNHRQFFEEHRAVYESEVRAPMLELEAELAREAAAMDPSLVTGRQALSRMLKDTRYAKSGGPYHDYSWLMYKPRGRRKSEFFGPYFSITPVSFSYGMGCYMPDTGFMQAFRTNLKNHPSEFYAAVEGLSGFELSGDDFKRPPQGHDEIKALYDGALAPFYIKKFFYMEHSSKDIKRAMRPEFAQEVREGLRALAPLYAFMHGLNAPARGNGGQEG